MVRTVSYTNICGCVPCAASPLYSSVLYYAAPLRFLAGKESDVDWCVCVWGTSSHTPVCFCCSPLPMRA